jgi:Ca2+-binding RTX toxin-like protein
MLQKMPDYKAVLSGQSWNYLPTLASPKKPVFLTYTFNPSSWSGTKLSAADRDAARHALDMWGDASGIRFIEVRGSDAELKFQWQWQFQNTVAWAQFPELSRDDFGVREDRVRDSSGGNVYLNTQHRAELSQNANYKLYVLLHEIGHALGLKHPFHKMEHNKQLLGSGMDHIRHTVMSYTGADSDMGPVKLGSLDIQAIQSLYGSPAQDGRQVGDWNWSKSKQTLTQTGKTKADVIYGVAVKDVIKGLHGDDKLYGFAGNDILHGNKGNDALSGGNGNDRFVFDYRLSPSRNYDRILDFNNSWESDRIELSSTIFKNIQKGRLSADAFVDGKAALDKDDRIIFHNEGARVAYYDKDGSGSSAPVRFAKIFGTADLSASDFFIV